MLEHDVAVGVAADDELLGVGARPVQCQHQRGRTGARRTTREGLAQRVDTASKRLAQRSSRRPEREVADQPLGIQQPMSEQQVQSMG